MITVATESLPQADAALAGVEVAIARRAFMQVWRGACICAVVFGGTVASSALSYAATFRTEGARHDLAAATSADTGLAVLLGPVTSVDTVGGYTVYKCFVSLTTIGAIWALLATTRLLRGEEDAGRWQLSLAGATRPAQSTAATLLALGAAVGVVFLGTTLATLAVGRSPDVDFGVGSTALYGLSITIAPAVFVAVGACASQLARTRRLATGLGLVVFGIAFALRMLADSGPGTHWLLWATPFGWTELLHPFTANDVRPLIPAGVAVGVLCLAAMVLAARRDSGAGTFATRDVRPPRGFGLRSSFGLAGRLDLPVLSAWCAAAAAAGLLLGVIAKMTSRSVPASLTDTLVKFGVHGSFASQYFSVAFLLVATLVALLPAGQIASACEEELSGRLVNVLAGPVGKATWLGGRLLLASIGILAAGLLAGIASWVGAATQGVDIGLTTMLLAGVNVMPTALVTLGTGALVLSLAPRAAVGTVYGVVTWSMLVTFFSSLVSGMRSLDRLSLFHYMALAPAQDPVPATLAITTAAGVLLCAAAMLLADRRDLWRT